jgi:hypothetical protein
VLTRSLVGRNFDMGDNRNVGNRTDFFVERIGLIILAAATIAVLLLLDSQFVGL